MQGLRASILAGARRLGLLDRAVDRVTDTAAQPEREAARLRLLCIVVMAGASRSIPRSRAGEAPVDRCYVASGTMPETALSERCRCLG